jgi:hypothetical protein
MEYCWWRRIGYYRFSVIVLKAVRNLCYETFYETRRKTVLYETILVRNHFRTELKKGFDFVTKIGTFFKFRMVPLFFSVQGAPMQMR